jgi:2-polyprenyl-3-methyl-5-hydroxy-6-metoxy-1,4-benzoquinol methylase
MERICAICRVISPYITLFSPSKLDLEINAKIFSARRPPDRISSEWVKCIKCNLVRAKQNANLNLSDLYEKSLFNYSNLVPNLSRTYFNILKNLKGNQTSVMEIGGGNGFMLELLSKHGYTDILEVEPSLHAFDSASEKIRENFFTGMFDDQFRYDRKFDLLVNFHVFDHVPDPLEFLLRCKKFLNTDGYIVIAVHNQQSISAKILKSKSPIYDIEHTYLYSKKTLSQLLDLAGYKNIKVQQYWNWLTVEYLIHLMPLPVKMKLFLNSIELLKKISVYLPLGNIHAIAKIN